MNRYWIPHLDIHRKIITQELQYHLGRKATVRPYTLEVSSPWFRPLRHHAISSHIELIQGDDGFLITTPGSCLTDVSYVFSSVQLFLKRWQSIVLSSTQEQIDDICRKSREYWDRQTRAKLRENPSKILKRPLHQPVTMSKNTTDNARMPESRRSRYRRS